MREKAHQSQFSIGIFKPLRRSHPGSARWNVDGATADAMRIGDDPDTDLAPWHES
jgi:hypothetical protein